VRALGNGDLVLCSGTLPRSTTLLDRLSAAASNGFAGISLWGRDFQAARDEGYADTDIGTMIADHGLAVAELDPAWWWLPGSLEKGRSIPPSYDEQEVFAFAEEEIFRVADVVGARSLNAVDVFGGDWSADDAAASFATLCDRAADHGLLVHVEWLPWSRIPDLAAAWEIVRLAGRSNGGVAVDAWHLVRSGGTADDVRGVPGEFILAVQLDDGDAEVTGDPVAATLHDRRLPGEGQFDLGSLLDALEASGCEAPIGVEVFSDELHSLGPREAARRAADATRAVVAGARKS
jgi:sugar phosphate isomerase/epimerase